MTQGRDEGIRDTSVHRELFVPNGPHSRKIKCRVCGRNGYPVFGGRSWTERCLRGHAPCPHCGRMNYLRKDGTPRGCVRQHLS